MESIDAGMKAGPIASRLARRVCAIEYPALPDAVLAQAKRCVLDQLGVQIRGARLPQIQPAFALAREVTSADGCTLPISTQRTSAPYAAFVRGACGHSCEFDDSHFQCGHPGACIVPVALALGEREHVSGATFLAAIVAGYEAMALAIGPVHRSTLTTGWHGTKVGGVFGAAATAARLLGLDIEQTTNALAIAGSEASGTMEYDQSGGEVKRFHAGMAARSGLEAALLASAGLTGPATIFEGPRGIHRLFGNGSEPDFSCWDVKYHISEVIFKLYPTVGTHAAALDLVRELLAARSFQAADVAEIVVSVAPWAVAHGGSTTIPTDCISAQFNLGFSIALRLLFNTNSLEMYMDHRLWDDPQVRDLIAKIRVRAMTFGPGETELGAAVSLTLRDGTVLLRRCGAFHGHPSHPATDDEIGAKFEELVSDLISPARARAILMSVQQLDLLDDVTELSELTSSSGEASA